jgi:hypothetical protein
VYWALALLCHCWAAWSLFAINMRLKDVCSYWKKEGWKEYQAKSYMALPKVFKSDIINLVLYALVVVTAFNLYQEADHYWQP